LNLIITAAVAVAAPAATAAPATVTTCPDVVTSQAFVCRALEAQKGGNTTAAATDYTDTVTVIGAGLF